MLHDMCLAHAGPEREEEAITLVYASKVVSGCEGRGLSFSWLPSCILTAGAAGLVLACYHRALLTPVRIKRPQSQDPSLSVSKELVVPVPGFISDIVCYIRIASCSQKMCLDSRDRSHI